MTQSHNSYITTIIEELIALDPAFAERRTELETILSELISQKENIPLSQEFIHTLRTEVLRRSTASKPSTSFLHTIIHTIHMNTKQLTLGAVGGLATIAVVVGAYTLVTHTLQSPLALKPSAEPYVVALGPQAFGTLSDAYTTDTTTPMPAALGSEAALSSRSVVSSQSTPVVGFGGGGTSMVEPAIADKMMIMPYYEYSYEYVGDAIELPTDLPVYRRRLSNNVGSAIAQAVRGIDNGLINLPSGLFAENLTLRSSGNTAYSYHIDLRNQSVNIYQEHTVYTDTWDGRAKLTDAELISAAKNFLEDRGVSLETYGTPVVDDRYTRYQYEEVSFIPQHITVIFPLMTPAGETIYESGGDMPAGIGITVDQMTRQVMSAWNIKQSQFASSQYDLATDVGRIVEVAENGGSTGDLWYPEDADLATFTLGTPTVVYIEYFKYDEARSESLELYVPALRFPIVDRPTEDVYFNPQYVTVPLVAELLIAPVGQPEPYPLPRPMPVEPFESPASRPADDTVTSYIVE